MSQDVANTSSTMVDSGPRTVDFFKLPRPVQDRVVASLTGHGMPLALSYQPTSLWQVYRWGCAATLLFAALITLGAVGFGQLGAPSALHDTRYGGAYLVLGGLLGVACAACFLAARPSDYPFALGTYLLPVGVIDVERRRLLITPLGGLRRVRANGPRGVTLEFNTGSFRFPLPSGATLDSLSADLEGYKHQWATAFSAGDRRTLAGLDPVRDSGFSNPLSSRATIPRVRTRATPRVLVGALVGAGLGLLFFFGRNALAERSIYRKAVTANTEQAYRAYLANGGKRPDVLDWRLPQAELLAASGSLEAVERYAAANSNSKIKEDIEKLLRFELLKELQRVRATSDLEALESFKAQHPSSALIADELAAVRKDVFREALESFKAKYRPSDEAAAFFEGAIRHAEVEGPLVELRIRRELPPSMDRADAAIRKSSYFSGQKSVPSQYFRGAAAESREARALAELADVLQPAFSPSVLRFVTKPGEEGPVTDVEVDTPTLLLTYKTEMSGGYTTNRPRGVYVGLGMMFQATGLVPGEKQSFRFKDSSWLPPDINAISKNLLKPEQVYEANANEGFERFLNRLLERLVGEKAARPIDLDKGANP